MKNLKYWEEKRCKKCDKLFWAWIKRKTQFCSGECSAQFTANDPTRLSKIRKTKKERYGNETYVNPEKAKATCIEKYGVDNVSKSDEIIERIKAANMEKYGVEWSWQADGVKEKIKQTNLIRYGAENPSQANSIKQKKIDTYLKRYGVENPFQCEKIKQNIRALYKEKFGVEYPSQIAEVRQKISEVVRKNNYKLLHSSKRIVDNVDILFSEDEYKGATSEFKYKVKCKKCGNIFEDHFDGNHHPRCMVCYPNATGSSYTEKEILSYIRSLLSTENIVERDRKLLGNRELDIYIPAKNIAIEYNGLFWHSEFNGHKSKLYHMDKLDRCLQQGIRLITIFEDEWALSSDIIKAKLNHMLHTVKEGVYARECDVQEILTKQSSIFLGKHHLQGYCPSSVNIGLLNNGELIAVMTFGKPRISLGGKDNANGEYELLRYSTSKLIVGGASKLLSHFIKTHAPSKIISYADRRWSTGDLYGKLGFSFVGNTDPNYWYFKPGYAIRYHRFGFRKSVLHKKMDLFIPELTEWENMQLNGYDRIWDCGNLKYEWRGT